MVSTWIKAIQKGFFQSWPGLTSEAVHKHLEASEATAKGHLDQTRKNIRSTRTTTNHPEPLDVDPTQETNNEATDFLFATIEDTGRIYTDQTGRFPVTSSKGSQYILVLYDYDSNAILTEPLKNRAGGEILRAYTKLCNYLSVRGFKPKTHWLDNEASTALKTFNRAHHIEYQLVPPHMHRRNAAERAIRTFKNHLVTGLCSTDDAFPLHLWDRLLPQATQTLNMLRPSRRNPHLSAYTVLEGVFDFNKTPMAPPGTKVILHEKPNQRKSWDPHGTTGWYLGPAMEHYRCYRVFVSKSKAERITDTVEFFPQRIPVPYRSPADVAVQAPQELVPPLQQKTPPTPFAHVGHDQLEAIQQLADIFRRHSAKPPTTAPRVPITAPLPFSQARAITPPPAPRVNIIPATPAPSPRVLFHAPAPATPSAPHRYPTRHMISQTQDEVANAMFTMSPDHNLLGPHFANAIIDPDTGASMEYRHLIKSPRHQTAWSTSFANELDRLAQGALGRVTGTDTIFFIDHSKIPDDRRGDVTYGRIVVLHRPEKTEPNRTRLTVGGNLIDYPGDVSTPTADTTTAKMVINSTISRPNARYMCGDIRNFYLGTPMERFEYMRLPIALIPQESIDAYNLLPLIHKGHIYIEIRRGMYGLPQAGILANQLLTRRLEPHGYYQCRHTPGLWRHKWRPLLFSLVVDDFGVQYVGRQHVDHLIAAIEEHYEFSKDWAGELYCGITIKWDYTNRTVDLSMPGYVQAMLHKYQHPAPPRLQHAPHASATPNYGVKVQFAEPTDSSALLSPAATKRVQQITGTLLYYARAVDSTMLVALGTIAQQQSKATLNTARAVHQLLDYAHTHPDAAIRYRASDMILRIHSDASYLSEAQARSRSGGHFYLGDKPSNQPTRGNGALLTTSNIMRNVMSSAAEAECGALFNNTQEAVPLRNTLEEMGHPQPPTPVEVDNSTTAGFANQQIKQRKSKSMDMRFYWIQDRVRQRQFNVHWRPGSTNLADYFTKHHPSAHHRKMRNTYLHNLNNIHSFDLRGCVNPGSPEAQHVWPSSAIRTQNPMTVNINGQYLTE